MKQLKCLLGGKRVRVNRLTQVSSERESCPHGTLNLLHAAFLLGFLWPIILLCLVLSLVYLKVLPCVHKHLLGKMESSEEAHG